MAYPAYSRQPFYIPPPDLHLVDHHFSESSGTPRAAAGQLHRHRVVESDFVAPRDVFVYTPPGYNLLAEVKFPVLYMHDGQNLFSDQSAFMGKSWGLKECADKLILSDKIAPVIIVGISQGPDRIQDYTHVQGTYRGSAPMGGDGKKYGQFVLEELMPFVQKQYRALTGPEHTAIAGASLGGLVSLNIVLDHPGVFGRVAMFSPTLFWGDDHISHRMHESRLNGTRLFLSMGTRDGRDPEDMRESLKAAQKFRDLIIATGVQEGRKFVYHEHPDGHHNEASWGEIMGERGLQFLAPPAVTAPETAPN